jgi:hypothetical protein
MSLKKNLSRLALDFVEKKVTVKTIPDESQSRTYEGTIIGVAYRRNENAIIFYTDQPGFYEFAVHPPHWKSTESWYSIKYGSGAQLVDMVEVPLIDKTIPISKLLGRYLKEGIE